MRKFFCAALIAGVLAAVGGCGQRNADKAKEQSMPHDSGIVLKDDATLYGLACDGTSDSVLVVWPFAGDPLQISCIDAQHDGKIIGKPEIGDLIGVTRDPEDSTEAVSVVNIDELKGTWTYPVTPVMKDLKNMSKRMQRRMLARMDDSTKATLLAPREYGFTIKRSNKAQAVGRVMRRNTLEDDSPVEYPKVKDYRWWYTWNGKLLLVSTEMPDGRPGEESKPPTRTVDTLDFVCMRADSLVLRGSDGQLQRYHRLTNTAAANQSAQKAANKQAKRPERQ